MELSIEELAFLTQTKLNDRDKEWLQVIKSITDYHPVSMTDAVNRGIRLVRARKSQAWDECFKAMSEWIDGPPIAKFLGVPQDGLFQKFLKNGSPPQNPYRRQNE